MIHDLINKICDPNLFKFHFSKFKLKTEKLSTIITIVKLHFEVFKKKLIHEP